MDHDEVMNEVGHATSDPMELHPVMVHYLDSKGVLSHRILEPYSIRWTDGEARPNPRYAKGWSLYARQVSPPETDGRPPHVRAFRLDRIMEMDTIGQQSYEPLWEVEFKRRTRGGLRTSTA